MALQLATESAGEVITTESVVDLCIEIRTLFYILVAVVLLTDFNPTPWVHHKDRAVRTQ